MASPDQAAAVVEPYKLSEIFSIIPEYDGNQIFLQTFLNSCNCAYSMAVGDQKLLLTLHIKNKLRGRAAELINSRNPTTWEEIKQLLNLHFGDSRDLTSLIQDLQRIHQLPNESALTFVSRLQTHNAKMHSAIQKQGLTFDQKQAQSDLIETMTLNTLLAGLEPRLGQIIRAGNPVDMLQATNRIRRELQLSYFQNQKFQKPNSVQNTNTNQIRKPNSPQKICSFCKRTGHLINECRTRQQSQFQNFSRPNFQNNANQNPQPIQRSNFQPNQLNQAPRPFQQQNPNFRQNAELRSAIRPNPNFNQNRPSAIQTNPNFNRFNQQKTHHLNYENNSECYNHPDYFYPEHFGNYDYHDNTVDYTANQPEADYTANQNEHDYTANQFNDEFIDISEHQNFPNTQFPTEPPDYQPDQTLDTITTQIQTMNLDSFNPNLNFSEETFI